MTRTTFKRRGVTLVEMLVATAMCILGMWMLTWMFQQATASFSLANSQVTLTSQERMVTTIMTRDLEAAHFADDDDPRLTNRGRKLSDIPEGTAPKAGYFYARSAPPGQLGNPASEGPDGYGFQTSRSTNHFMQFTSILPDTPGNRYYAEVSAGSGKTYSGTAAEISYFLVESGRTAGGVVLHDLMRVQRLVALTQYDANDYFLNAIQPNATTDAFGEVMAADATRMFTLADLATSSTTRFNRQPRSLTSAQPSRRYGEDRLMSNVVSFEIKFTGQGPGWPASFGPPGNNTDHPYDNFPANFNYEYDTARPRGTANDQPGLHITGVQIRIRGLSGTTARQTTIVISL